MVAPLATPAAKIANISAEIAILRMMVPPNLKLLSFFASFSK